MNAKPSFPVAAAVALLCALCASVPAFAQITAPPRPAVGTNAASNSVGQTAPTLTPLPLMTQTPFQVTVPINVNNFVYTPVTIPSGKRLVIAYVSLSGAAAGSGGGVQPIAILAATVNGTQALYYFSPTPSSTVADQYYLAQNTTIYADALEVAPAFAGYSPSLLVFDVVISGYLVEN